MLNLYSPDLNLFWLLYHEKPMHFGVQRVPLYQRLVLLNKVCTKLIEFKGS